MSFISSGAACKRSYGKQIERSMRRSEELMEDLKNSQQQMRKISLAASTAIIDFQTLHQVEQIPLDFFVSRLKELELEMDEIDRPAQERIAEVNKEIRETIRQASRKKIDPSTSYRLKFFGIGVEEIDLMQRALEVGLKGLQAVEKKLLDRAALYKEVKEEAFQQIMNGGRLLPSFGAEYRELSKELDLGSWISKSRKQDGSVISKPLFTRKRDPRFTEAFRAAWDPSKTIDDEISFSRAIEMLLNKKRHQRIEREPVLFRRSSSEVDFISGSSQKRLSSVIGKEATEPERRSEGPEDCGAALLNPDLGLLSYEENFSQFAPSETDSIRGEFFEESEEKTDSEDPLDRGDLLAKENHKSSWISPDLLECNRLYSDWSLLRKKMEEFVNDVKRRDFNLSEKMRELRALHSEKTKQKDLEGEFLSKMREVEDYIEICVPIYNDFFKAARVFYRESLDCSHFYEEIVNYQVDKETAATLKGLRFPTQQMQKYPLFVDKIRMLAQSLREKETEISATRKGFERVLEQAFWDLQGYKGAVGYWDLALRSIGLGKSYLGAELERLNGDPSTS